MVRSIFVACISVCQSHFGILPPSLNKKPLHVTWCRQWLATCRGLFSDPSFQNWSCHGRLPFCSTIIIITGTFGSKFNWNHHPPRSGPCSSPQNGIWSAVRIQIWGKNSYLPRQHIYSHCEIWLALLYTEYWWTSRETAELLVSLFYNLKLALCPSKWCIHVCFTPV